MSPFHLFINIYFICSQADGHPYSAHDLTQLLLGLGLSGHAPCHLLLSLHAALVSHPDLQRGQGHGGGGGIAELLRAGALAVEQTRRGATVTAAMMDSVTEVYVRPERNAKYREVRARRCA